MDFSHFMDQLEHNHWRGKSRAPTIRKIKNLKFCLYFSTPKNSPGLFGYALPQIFMAMKYHQLPNIMEEESFEEQLEAESSPNWIWVLIILLRDFIQRCVTTVARYATLITCELTQADDFKMKSPTRKHSVHQRDSKGIGGMLIENSWVGHISKWDS